MPIKTIKVVCFSMSLMLRCWCETGANSAVSNGVRPASTLSQWQRLAGTFTLTCMHIHALICTCVAPSHCRDVVTIFGSFSFVLLYSVAKHCEGEPRVSGPWSTEFVGRLKITSTHQVSYNTISEHDVESPIIFAWFLRGVIMRQF